MQNVCYGDEACIYLCVYVCIVTMPGGPSLPQAALLEEASEVLRGTKGLKLSSFPGAAGPSGGPEMPLGAGTLPIEAQHYYEGLQPAPIMVYEVPAGNIVPFDSLVPVPLAKGLGEVKEGEGSVGGVDLLQGGVGEGVYATAPQEVHPPLYVLHQPHKKDGVAGLEQHGDGLVLGGREGGEGAFPRVGGEGTAMMPIGAEFSLISSSCYDTNMAQLSTTYHGSDTDSEVALTLASLGTPKLERATTISGSSSLAQAFQDLEPQPVVMAKKAADPPPPPPPQRPTLVLRSRRSRAANAHNTVMPSTATTATTTTTSTTPSTVTTRKRRRKDSKAAVLATTTTSTTNTAASTITAGGGGLDEGGGRTNSGGSSFIMPDSVLAVHSVSSPAPIGANGTTNALQQQEAQKENLLGQLLKASEQCEPASLIPAGVVDDVIPAVGYRIMDMTNLGEMVRMMHRCPGLGTIVIQEQASLREGAVSQLSVICTSCQVGTAVCTVQCYHHCITVLCTPLLCSV